MPLSYSASGLASVFELIVEVPGTRAALVVCRDAPVRVGHQSRRTTHCHGLDLVCRAMRPRFTDTVAGRTLPIVDVRFRVALSDRTTNSERFVNGSMIPPGAARQTNTSA